MREGKSLVRSAVSLVEDYRGVNERVVWKTPVLQTRWHPPDPPRFKMNVDATDFNALRAMGAGMVLQDSQGVVFAAMCKRIPADLSTLDAEAKSMEIAVQFAWELRIKEVYFETDSSNLKNILTDLSDAPASLELITENILAQLDRFCFVSVISKGRAIGQPIS